MPNTFKLATLGAGVYVSKAGNSSNAGTKDSPKLSVVDIPTSSSSANRSVIGTGGYYWPGPAFYEKGYGDILCDGTVKFLGDNINRTALGFSGTSVADGQFEASPGYSFRGGTNGNPCRYTRCTFKVLNTFAGAPNSGGVSIYTFEDCILINVNLSGNGELKVGYNYDSSLELATFNRCIFINCALTANAQSVTNCYIDKTSSIKAVTASNNNVDPRCVVAEGYGLNVNGAGFSLSSPGGISKLPDFNSVANEDFTLKSTSEHLTKGIGPVHLRFAQTWIMRSSATVGQPATTANTWLENSADGSRVNLLTCTNFNWSAGESLYIAENESGNFLASYRTDSLIFAGNPQELLALPVITGLNFNTDFPGLESQFNSNSPEVFNNNVPRANSYTPGSAGRNPARLTARYRFSTRIAPRSNVDADWFPNDGTFLEMEIGGKPLWNQSTNKGNGSPDFVQAQAQPVVATSMQVEYVAVNNYFSR